MEGPVVEQEASKAAFIFAVSFFFHELRVAVVNN